MTTTAARGLRVTESATAVGVRPDTIRDFERAGLLPAPERTAAGYRSYDVGALDRLRFIQGAQRLGSRLADIRTLLTVRDTGTCPCEPAEDLLRRRLVEIEPRSPDWRRCAPRWRPWRTPRPPPPALHRAPARGARPRREVTPRARADG
ncbi:MerR family transcriptional regulator [Geodermatophilus obscurus]|uniref:MerR family transcriptional regulator n=1 Tax=Geodermatophilus obscurus TaxID=1861 RepID=UPI001FCA562F|nr:MerR family transcriptional regulator [Geodermatophilus obscurus]